MSNNPIGYMRDVGSDECPCFVVCANGDPGSFPVYTRAGLSEVTEALRDARGAIASLDDDALGWIDNNDNDQPTSWPIKSELLAKIDKALATIDASDGQDEDAAPA